MKLYKLMIFFLFIFIQKTILYADDSIFDNWVLFFNKYLNSDEEELSEDELSPSEEELYDDELFFSEEEPSDDELFFSEEEPSDDEQYFSEEIPPDYEPIISEELSSADEIIIEETFPDEDDYIFYEAPELVIEVPKFEPRSFDDIFPDFSWEQRIIAMGDEGLRNYFKKDESPSFIPNPELEIDLLSEVMKKKPSHII